MKFYNVNTFNKLGISELEIRSGDFENNDAESNLQKLMQNQTYNY